MTYTILIEPSALQDLMDIKNYITKNDSLIKANIFIAELQDGIYTLSQMPQRCRKSYYTNEEDVHDFIYKKYTTVFKILENKVHILAVFRQKKYR